MLVAEVLADRPDDVNVGEEAAAQREVHGGSAQHPIALAEGRAHGVKGDRTDHRQRHGGASCQTCRSVRAIQVKKFGGPEVMDLVELHDPEPGDGMVVVDVARAGINFADTHATRDDYLAKQSLPMIPGGEVSGTTPDGRGSRPSSPAVGTRRRSRSPRASSSRCPTASPTMPRRACCCRG